MKRSFATRTAGRLGEREIGRIFVKGPSVMAGYFDNDDATRAVIGSDGFMDTGDMGYWLDGELVITGRAKDLILHNGRNIWPQDIEWAAERIEPLRSGDVAAFAVEDENGEDEVIVLVQCRCRDRPGSRGSAPAGGRSRPQQRRRRMRCGDGAAAQPAFHLVRQAVARRGQGGICFRRNRRDRCNAGRKSATRSPAKSLLEGVN